MKIRDILSDTFNYFNCNKNCSSGGVLVTLTFEYINFATELPQMCTTQMTSTSSIRRMHNI